MEERRIAIVGSRTGISRDVVRGFVNHLEPLTTVVVSGGASGVDSWAVERAKERDIRTRVYPAQWKKHGKAAGFIRNELIVQNSDDVVAFWDGESKGTEHSITLAMKYRKPLAIMNHEGDLIRYVAEDGTVWERVVDERTEYPEGR